MNGGWAQAWVVLAKELVDGLRDRRSIFSALLYPLIGPLLIGLMFSVIAEQQKGTSALELPVVGASHAGPLVAHLEGAGIDVVEGPEDPEAAVARGEVAMVLVIPADFPARFEAQRPASVQLVSDGARNDVRADVRRVQLAVARWSTEMGALRMMARGVSPEVASPVQVEDVDVSTPEASAANVLNFIPMFIIMAAFIGGMQIAVDATAGERERKSLEPLLTTPVSRLSVVLGKWLAASIFGVVSVTLTTICCVVVLGRLPLEELGLSLALGPGRAVGMVMIALPLVPMAVGLQLLVGTFSRTYKEAQTYMSLLVFVPMLPGLMLSLYPADGATWTRLVPSLGQQLLMTDALGGAPPQDWAGLAAAAGGAALALGLACALVTARLLGREQIVFG